MPNAIEKLIELLNNSFAEQYEKRGLLTAPHTAADLIANGVTVQENCKSCAEATQNCIVKLQEQIAELRSVQEWISVKEHLPQDDLPFGALCEIVQVLLDDGTVTVGWCNRGLKCWYYMPIQATNFVGHDYDKTPVIAWQPLAQPPKGE